MPIMEHPLDDSWGYQITGFFSPTSTIRDTGGFPLFRRIIFIQNGIGVILDWVPGHFPKDESGLGSFDGSALYEYADDRLGEHKEWGTYVFNYARDEVRSFLTSGAIYWLNEFHADGLRVDAVSSMLYLNYGRTNHVVNRHGGVENLEAVSFLQQSEHRGA
jgi:1,4-alpha-glucan branching enzyme